MKKLTLAAGLLFSLGGISSAFGAPDGTITFNGRVVDQTCTVTTGTSGNFDVTLPTVNKTQLAADGAVAGATRFNIELTGCKPAATGGTDGVRAYFLPNSQYVDPNTHNLKNIAQTTAAGTTPAEHVQIQLTHADTSKVIAVGENVDTQENKPYNSWFNFENDTTVAGTAKAKLTYYAQYIAVGAAATAGVVQSKVEYNIIYK